VLNIPVDVADRKNEDRRRENGENIERDKQQDRALVRCTEVASSERRSAPAFAGALLVLFLLRLPSTIDRFPMGADLGIPGSISTA
jgi:hypothetical protein